MQEKWFMIRRRYVPAVWPMHTFWTWPVHAYFKVAATGKVLHVWEEGEYMGIYEDKRTRIELGNAIVEKILEESKDLKKFRAKGIEAGEEVTDFCRKFADKAPAAVIPKFVSFLDGLAEEYASIMKTNMHYWVFGPQILVEMVKKELVHLPPGEVDEIIRVMAAPVEESYSQKVLTELSHITEIARKQGVRTSSVQDGIESFSNKYFWFPYEYVGPAIWDATTVTSLIENDIASDAKAHSQPLDHRLEQEAFILKYKFSDKILHLFKIIQTLSLMQDDRKRYNAEISYYVNGVILPELGTKLGIERDEALYLDQELIKLYEKDKGLFAKRLALRTEMLAALVEDGVSVWYEGWETCEKLLRSLDIPLTVHKGVKEVKGQTAYKGKVTGRVRVLRTSQVTDFKEGDVIVTGMTTPDFAPLMKKAAAIVTNEGGITCHAAIVSRELKIPCVIGTKIATQVFKDGDMVEVDATNGTVAILEER